MTDDHRTIYKYQFSSWSTLVVYHSYTAKFLKAGIQDNKVTFWVEVDLTSDLSENLYMIIGTGHKVPEGGVHMDTVQDGEYVWHIYKIQ